MRVFVVGASGVIGRRLVPQLIERGHDVIGSARSPEKAQRLRGLGAEPVVLDGRGRAGIVGRGEQAERGESRASAAPANHCTRVRFSSP